MYRHYSLNSKFLELQESLRNLIHNTLDTDPSLVNKVLNQNIWLDTHSYCATRGNKVYKPVITMFSKITVIFLVCLLSMLVSSHGPPLERDNEDITMGRKMGAKWCSMAKVCNHDRVPICGISHAGDVVGFRDLCDMFDYNCIRRRNYKQTACPEDKSILTVSRRPTNSFYDD